MSVAPLSLDGVCEGCLSPERQQPAEITEIEIKKLFFEIINKVGDQNVENLKLWLCSECKSSIKKFISFRRQVQDAHEILLRHLITSSGISTTTYPAVTLTKQSLAEAKAVDAATKELAFIKVEDGVDEGGCLLDDAEDFKTVLKPEISQPNHLDVSFSCKTKEDFTESDDEPLFNKRSKRGKGRGRKKKKNDDDAQPKVDRRKCPAPKREKPAGVVDTARVRLKLQQLNVPPGMLQCVVLSWQEVEAERQRGLCRETYTRHQYRCADCVLGFNHRSKLQAHMNKHSATYTRHQYRCADCVLGFNHRSKLQAHMNKHSASAGPLECGVCRVRCKHAHALSAHKRRHRVRWRCTVCGHTSSRAAVAADHCTRQHHAPPPQHTCRLCGHTDTSLAKLRGHMKSHAERQRCELCGKTFRDRTSLRTHLFLHSGEKEFSCPRCDKRFAFRKAMELHALTHDGHAHLYCHQCDVTFKNRMSYTQHMKYSLKHVDPAQLK
uniref:C2H2-type domain-containing protein n=1 Tax=Heliothis virescens TaxID=7102 RepID=A0A2A4JEY0_HELVI